VLQGQPGAFKTFTAIAIALHVYSGLPLCGLHVTKADVLAAALVTELLIQAWRLHLRTAWNAKSNA
jgi:hypothetical protein